MLEFFYQSRFRRRQLRRGWLGEHVDGFADRLHRAGYKRRPAQLVLRGAAHLRFWASEQGVSADRLSKALLHAFIRHLPACTCSSPFQGHDAYHAAGARRFVEYLQQTGVVPPPDGDLETVSPLIGKFRHWMLRHRGVTPSTLANYVPLVKEFLQALGDDAAAYDASRVRSFIFARASRHGLSRAKSVVNAVRMFLRFLATERRCPPDLVAAVPGFAQWKLSSLPRYLPAADVERLVAVCDPATPSGSRDRAVILLLARLGLRASDVRDLRFADLHWPRGRLRVMGKGRSETWLPFPQDAGDAVLHYLERVRPPIDDDHVFLRVHAPIGPFPSSGPISKLVWRAIRRAGIKAPSTGAHVLRHSAATHLLREGASLEVVGAVLRHRSVDTTAHYAKVDISLLRSVAQPWPDDGGSAC
jgi:site-specific recombinase XerD